MLPSGSAYTRGVRDTSVEISQGKPLELSSGIRYLNPQENQFLNWVLKNGRKVPSGRRVFGHLEGVPNAMWVEYAGADETSQGVTALTLGSGHGARVTIGSRIYFPRTQEIIRLNAVMSTDATGAVARNFGRGNATTSLLKKGDKGVLLSPAFEEGFTTPTGVTSIKEYHSFNMTELSLPVQLTNPEVAEAVYDNISPWERALWAVGVQAKRMMSSDLLFGGQVTDNTTFTTPIGASEGLDNFTQTNRYSAARLSRMDLWDIIMEWRSKCKRGGVLVVSGAFMAMVSGWALTKTRYEQVTKRDGIQITSLLTPWGEYDLFEDDTLNEDPYLMGTVFGIPNFDPMKGRIDYRPLVGNGANWDIRYNPINRDEVHAKEGEIYGIVGFHPQVEEEFMLIEGLRFAA